MLIPRGLGPLAILFVVGLGACESSTPGADEQGNVDPDEEKNKGGAAGAAGPTGETTTTPGDAPAPGPTPSTPPTKGPVLALSVGFTHACVLVTGGAVKCWGGNGSGQLGNGGLVDSPTPVDVPGLSGISAVLAARNHSCALASAGPAKCWGTKLGVATGSGTDVAPTDVPGTETAIGFGEGGDSHPCVIRRDKTPICWPTNVAGARNASTIRDVVTTVSDANTVHALLGNGQIACMGGNAYNSCGNPDAPVYVDPSTPRVTVKGIRNAKEIAKGSALRCAVLADGAVRCWGNTRFPTFADGASESATPAPVSDITTARHVSLGTESSCVVTTEGTVRCWGSNTRGQLGNGSQESSRLSVPVADLRDVDALRSGARFRCALHNGHVSCWGQNDVGQLGSGTKTDSARPVPVVGL